MKAKINRKTNSRWVNLLILICIFVVPFGQSVYAYTFEKWINTDSSGVAYSLNYGSDNNLYIAGSGPYGWMSITDYVIASLDTLGNYRWLYHRDGGTDWHCEAFAVAYGDDGNIYATGYAPAANWYDDVAVARVDNSGIENWWQLVGPDNSDKGLAIDYGADGNVYVTGYVTNDGTGEDLFILSFRANGGFRWATSFDRDGSNDRTNALVYGDEMVFATGYTEEDNLMDFTVVGLDTAGNHDWSYWKDGTAHDQDEAKAVVYGDDGYIYAAGYTTNTDKNFTVVKLDPLSTEQWIYNSDVIGEANAIIYGDDGNVYAAGYSGGGGPNKDFCVVSLNPANGVANWVYEYDGPASLADEAVSLVYGGDGNIYVAGYSTKSSGGQTGKDILVISLDDSGNQRSIYTNTSAGNNDDEACSIVYGKDDYVYVAGYKNAKTLVLCLPNDFGPSIPVLCKPDSIGWTAARNTRFHWHPAVDQEGSVTGYRIEYDIDPLFTGPTGFNLSDTTRLIQLPDQDTTYYWRVKAKDDMDNWGDWSNIWMVTLDRTSPIVPSLISPANGSIIPTDLVTVEWSEVTFRNGMLSEATFSITGDKGPPSPIRYGVQFATDESFTNIVREDTVAGTDTTVDLDDDWYWWRVYAFDLAGNTSGSYSEEWTFALDISNPTIDSTTEWPDTTYQGPFEVYSKLTDATTIDSVILFYRRHKDENDFWSIKMDPSVGGEWYKANIPAVNYSNDSVSYYIYAWDIAGHMSKWPEQAPDEYWSFIAYLYGIEEDNNHPVTFAFGLKNNPAKGKAMFSLALPTDASISLNIYDASGRLIDKLVTGRKSAGYHEIPWTSKANAAGVYFYSFESSYKNEIGKLILVK